MVESGVYEDDDGGGVQKAQKHSQISSVHVELQFAQIV
jgi:hypothetical protein